MPLVAHESFLDGPLIYITLDPSAILFDGLMSYVIELVVFGMSITVPERCDEAALSVFVPQKLDVNLRAEPSASPCPILEEFLNTDIPKF